MTKTGKMKATGLLKLHKLRMWQPWQAYHNLTYESKWKAEINRCWNEYTIKWKGENPGQALEKTRFEFMNAFIKDKYEAESLEVKAEVEKHHQNIMAKAPGEINKSYQELVISMCISRL